jgi:hypothetical protein
MILNSPTISGSLTVTGNIIASGSITLSGSVASASYAATASFVALAQSASNAVSAQTASFANAFTVAGTLTAQTLVVQTITSSVDFVTGSTRFGSIAANTHVFTGSLLLSGSSTALNVNNGSLFVSSSGFIGMNTTQSFNSTLTIAPLKTPGVALQVIADSAGRGTNLYTSDYVSLTTGSTLRMGFTGGSGNVSASIQVYNTGENTYGSLLLNSGGGNVGIGTSNPINKLHIVGDSNSIYQQAATSGSAIYWDIRNSAGTRRGYLGYGGTSNSDMTIYNTENGAIIFGTNNVESMRITSGGSVGIGVASPNHALAVNGSVGFYSTTPAQKWHIQYASSVDGLNFVESGVADYRMFIKAGGSVGINTSTPSGKLDVNGRVYIRTAGSSTDAAITFINQSGGDGTLFVTGTSTSLNYGFSTYSVSNAFYLYNNGNYDFVGSDVSDRRLKKNIITINYNATEKLMQLVPKSYNMIAHPSIKKSGFIAQEVKEILPDFVTGEETEEDYLGIDYNGILALAVKAIQELKTQNDALQSRIETLESK